MKDILAEQFFEGAGDIWKHLKPVELDLDKHTEFGPSSIHKPVQGTIR